MFLIRNLLQAHGGANSIYQVASSIKGGYKEKMGKRKGKRKIWKKEKEGKIEEKSRYNYIYRAIIPQILIRHALSYL